MSFICQPKDGGSYVYAHSYQNGEAKSVRRKPTKQSGNAVFVAGQSKCILNTSPLGDDGSSGIDNIAYISFNRGLSERDNTEFNSIPDDQSRQDYDRSGHPSTSGMRNVAT